MRSRWVVVGRLALIAVGLAASLPAGGSPSPSWERLTALVGDWEATRGGQPGRLSYRSS